MIGKKVLNLVAGAAVVCASTSAYAGDFSYVLPLFKDITSGANDELTVVPQINLVDDDTDDVPDRIKLRFRSYQAGTYNLVLKSNQRITSVPAAPCSSPVWEDVESRIKFHGQSTSDTAWMLVELASVCEENTGEEVEAFKTILYAGKVWGTTDSYIKTWDNWEVVGSNSVDWDDDGNNEMQLILAKDKILLSGGQTDVRVLYINWATGAVEGDNKYLAETTNY